MLNDSGARRRRRAVLASEFECAALDPAAAAQQLGEVDPDRVVAALAQRCLETLGARGDDDVVAVGVGVQAENGSGYSRWLLELITTKIERKMKTIFQKTVWLLCIAFAITSCSKDDDNCDPFS